VQIVQESNVVEWEKIGKTIRKIKCSWKRKEKCKLVHFTKCSDRTTKCGCLRNKCCTYAKRGKNIKRISCKWNGKSKCQTQKYLAHHSKLVGKHCKRIRECLFERRGCKTKKN